MRSISVALISLAISLSPLAAQNTVRLQVDATDAPRRIYHVRMSVGAKPGPMTLLYPEWIPGEHGPTGPVVNLVGLKIQSAGQAIPWKRDSVNMYAFHVTVPAGASSLDVAFDFIAMPATDSMNFAAGATPELAVINWNQLLLYPEGSQPDTLDCQVTLKVPNGWRYGTALPIQKESGNTIEFQPASMTTVVDSPLSAGAHYRTIDLGTADGISHYLHLASDSERALEVSPEVIDHYKSLVKQAGSLFGSRHYRSYHFLFTLSDRVGRGGLEHHESSDDRYHERALIDPEPMKAFGYLLPHEFVHSWNGKYRRPAGLISGGHDGGYDTPMQGDLLWVYEGLTEYLGEILTPRSGLWTPEDYRESLAATAAELDQKSGRTWRPLEDTAVAAQTLYGAGDDYADYRRGVDYYPEGTLIWLEADATIRQLSHGAKTLDDFCHLFHGGPSGAPALKPYTFDDVVAALNKVQPYDWAGFLNQRIHSTDSRAPLGGIERAGWKLTFDNVRSDFWQAVEEDGKIVDMSYSIGLKVKSEEGDIVDVRYGGPAQRAGVTPSIKLIAVNGHQFTPTLLREAVRQTATSSKPIELLTKNGDYYEVHRIDYRGGERYPHLTRNTASPDLLSEIIKPH